LKVNIKASLIGITWRVKVESKLSQDILHRLSHFRFDRDDYCLEPGVKLEGKKKYFLKLGNY